MTIRQQLDNPPQMVPAAKATTTITPTIPQGDRNKPCFPIGDNPDTRVIPSIAIQGRQNNQ